LKRTDASWLAGYFEGEGCVYLSRTRQTSGGRILLHQYPAVVIVSTDLDVLERVREITQMGTLTVQSNKKSKKMCYQWRAYGISNTQQFFRWVEPWLGKRRLARFIQVLSSDFGRIEEHSA
jgi:hypothetical protein